MSSATDKTRATSATGQDTAGQTSNTSEGLTRSQRWKKFVSPIGKGFEDLSQLHKAQEAVKSLTSESVQEFERTIKDTITEHRTKTAGMLLEDCPTLLADTTLDAEKYKKLERLMETISQSATWIRDVLKPDSFKEGEEVESSGGVISRPDGLTIISSQNVGVKRLTPETVRLDKGPEVVAQLQTDTGTGKYRTFVSNGQKFEVPSWMIEVVSFARGLDEETMRVLRKGEKAGLQDLVNVARASAIRVESCHSIGRSLVDDLGTTAG